jgi:hypothetical protein
LKFKEQTTNEPVIAVEGPSKLLNLKRKIGYDEINDEAGKRLAGPRNPSIQTMEVATEEALAGKRYIPMMEVD